MTAPTFTPFRAPKMGTQDKSTFKILKADFGDGYTQYTRNGLNNIRRSLTLGWEALTPAQVAVIKNFMIAQGGSDPFWYTPSDETTPVLWTCDTMDDTRDKGGLRNLNLTFTQSFVNV